MRALKFSHYLLLGSILLAVLALGLIRFADHYRAANTIAVYTLTPDPDKGAIRVRLEMTGVKPGRVLLLSPETGAVGGALPAAGEASGDPLRPQAAPSLWWALADENGRLKFEYEVGVARIDARHALLEGDCIFAVPLRSDNPNDLYGESGDRRVAGAASRIHVRFDLPRLWDAYTPWGEAYPAIDVPGARFARLRASLIALGDYLPRRIHAAGTTVDLVTRKTDPAREDEIEALLKDCLTAHAELVGPSPHTYMLVIADHPFRGNQASGRTSVNVATIDLSTDPNALRYPWTLRVVSHELFHLWNGGAVDLDPTELRWFAEGVTEYYALRALAVSGRLTLRGFADQLAATLDRLDGNPWADSSLVALGRGYGQDPRAWTATYAKGALAAWALDLRLWRDGGLDAVVRPMLQSGHSPDPMRDLAAAASGRARGLLDSLSGPGFRAALSAELAANGWRLVPRRSGRLTLGLRFFKPGTTEILDLDPEGPAARRGLQAGDRLLAVNERQVGDLEAVAEAFADAGSDPMQILIERDGYTEEFIVRPRPAYVTHVEAIPSPSLASSVPAPGRLPR
jgi:predicted metalloprotease with PDZ domain